MSAEGSTVIITGALGGGKTLHAVELILEHLASGGTVVTNIPLHLSVIAEWMRSEWALVFDPTRVKLITDGSIRGFEDVAIRGNDSMAALMVLDEAALDLNARDHREIDDITLNFVVLCRKLKIKLIFIAQDANMVAKQIRSLMQCEIHCRSLKKFLSLGGMIDGLPVFVRVPYVLELGKKPIRQSAKFSWGSIAFGKYDTHALHGDRATIFSALGVANATALERVKYPVWPYTVAALVGTAASAVTTTLCQ